MAGMTSGETAKVMEGFFDALRRGDEDDLRAVLADDVSWQQPESVPDWQCEGIDMVVERLGRGVVRELFRPGTFKLTLHRMMIDGNVAITQQGTSAVTHDGQPYAMEYCWIYSCDEGRIEHIREYLDTYVAAKVFNWDGS